jgi:natural product biosynthesis luciferase-like monooxygenase protein/FkbM family methyltransferase
MSDEFLRLLSALIAAPQRAVGEHALLGEDEIARVLGEWNATESDYTATPIHLQVHAQAGLTPSAVALIDGAVEWNYAQLWRRVERVSAHLSAQGAVPGERIGVFMDRSAEMVIAMLAVMRCGAAYVPLDPAYPRERIRYVCEDAGLRRVLVQSFLAHELPDRRLQAIAIDSLLDLANASADAGAASSDSAMPETVPSIGAEHAAYMIYTSGSTGRPKGVSLSHRNAANFFAALDRRDVAGGVAAGEVPCWLAVTSISFDISVLELLWTLARGHKVVLQPATPPAALLPMLAEATKAGGARAQIDFSLFYFASDADAAENEKYRLLLEGARFADREGFEAVWVPERHFHAFGGQFPNPSVAAAAIAAITERVKIRAGSVVLPLHDPLRVAEEWSMVDNLSDGRAGIAFASGWHFGDFVFFPENFEQRHRIMREGIDTVRALWRGESVVRRGGTGKDAELGTRPRPLQPELPVWITAAASPETFRYAGEIGANVLTHLLGQSLDELREKIEIYRAARAEHGHDPAAGRVTLMIHTFVGDDPETVRAHVEQPFKQYLRSSIGLLRPVAESQGLNLEVDMESVVDAGFERYFSTSALFGTPEACLDIATRIHALGVDEMACLIDFGVEIEAAIAGLDALARLKAMTQARSARVRHFARHGGGVPGSSALDSSALDLSALDLIRRHGVTHLQSTPTFAGLLLDQIETSGETPGLQRWLIGGEALPPRLAARIRERLPVRLLNMYGPTETTVWSANDTVDSDTITLGRPLANTRLYVLDPRGLPVPVGVPGELFIAGDGVAQSYWQRPDLTAERFLPDPFSPQPGRRMYRTGDIVRYRDDGRLQFVGRNDGQVKLRGFRIELGEIEAQLRNQPGVREAAVRVIAGAGQEPRLLAYVASDRAQTEPHTESAVGSSAGSAEDSRWPVARFAFPDGTAIFHSDERQLGALYKEVFEDRMYLRHGIVLQDHACVFDVGANVGSFSVFVQRNCRHPVVHSFEPIPPTFAALRRNAEWHGIDGKVHNCGLSDRAEVQPFTYYPQMSGLSGRFANAEEEIRAARSVVIDQLRREGADAAMSDEEIGEWLAESFRSQTFECRLRTLSEVIREEGIAQIDLLKIDVEKSECLVLGGIADEDWPKIQQIAIEVDGAENLQRVRDVLDARGFRYVVEDFVNVEAGEGVERFDVYMLYARREQIARPLPRPQGRPHRSAQATAAQGLCPDRLRMALKTALPEYMVPDAIHVLDALPRTPNGKLDAAALPTEAPRALVTQAVSPRSDQERTIAEIWQRVLGRSVASIHDNFFESGGNSLLVARVRAELQKAFGRNVSVVELFRYPTIASLADFFGQSEDAPRPSAAEASADRGAQRRQRIVRRGRGAADARATESEPEGVA